MKRTIWIALVALAIFGGGAVQAVTLDATDRGWYQSTGFHIPTNDNYLVGRQTGDLYNNFFVFDLSGVSGTVTSATLRLYAGSFFSSADPSETYTVSDFTGDIAALTAGTGGVSAFNDLGTGASYGSFVATPAISGTFIDVTLDMAAVADVNAHLGTNMAFGGSITTLGNLIIDQFLFGSTGSVFGRPSTDTQLILGIAPSAAVPEPDSLLLLIFSLAALLAFGSKGRRAYVD